MMRWGSIKQQMLIVAVLPLMLFAFALGVYFINSRVQDTDEGLAARGQTIARLLSVSVEFGLLTGNREMLANQVRAPLHEEDILEIVVLDQQFSELVRRSDSRFDIDRNAVYPRLEEQYGYFLAPVTTSGIAFQDLPEYSEGDNSKEIIGWVAVVMSQEPTLQYQQQIIINGVLLLILGLCGSLYLASRFSRNIIEPVEDLTQVVKDIEAGQLWRRAEGGAYGEMRSLLRGFNRMAKTVEESNTMLELRVNEQTRELRRNMADIKRSNYELSSARERADRANQAKDEFLARMSHELRTPLTSVLGFSRMLQQSGLNAEQQEFSRIINLTSGMLLSIIDDILDFSRLESNAIVLEILPFDLRHCVEEVTEMLAPVAHEKRIELIMVLDPRLPQLVKGDPNRLRQILTNLISNAIKFTDQGSVQIKVYPQGGAIHLDVIDTGIGIPSLQLDSLFNAFVQADTSITRRYGGSGLGLAISQHLTELMGGEIKLDSREGTGTQVCLAIPFAQEKATPMGPFKPLYQRVLIFAEQAEHCRGICYQLLPFVADCQVTSSRDLLRNLLQQQDWDLVLVNHSSHEEFGPGVIRWLRQVRSGYSGQLVLLNGAHYELPEELKLWQLRKPLSGRVLNALMQSDPLPVGDTVEEVALLSRSLRVLVAEDNNFNRLLLRRILEQAGAEVLEVISGLEAVTCADEFDPDLIIMDVHMPEMDGIEATRLIRQNGFEKPILALTANVVEREHEILQKAGVNEVLLKPIDDTVLISHINRYTDVLEPLESEQSGTLDRYGISKHALRDELQTQLVGIEQSVQPADRGQIRHHTHQLIGLAGLYEMPELDEVSNDLNHAAKHEDMRTVWTVFWRLKRLIENEQY